MTIEVLDPTYGDDAEAFSEAERPDSLSGLTIALLSNGKQGTGMFFDALEALMQHGRDVGDGQAAGVRIDAGLSKLVQLREPGRFELVHRLLAPDPPRHGRLAPPH